MATLQQAAFLHIFRHFSPRKSPSALRRNFESFPPLRKYHSQSARELLRNQYSILERGVQMKKLFLGSVALVAMLGGPAAFAADMPLRAPAPVIVATWTGCYVGLSIGTANGKAKTEYGANTLTFPGTANPIPAGTQATSDINLSGMIGGGQVGCNYQVGAWVFGIEGDWSVTNKDGQEFETLFAPAFRLQVTESWLATARGRIGYTVTDKWLWYVTGGGAWARVRDSNFGCVVAPPAIAGACLTAAVPTAQENNVVSGWTVGLGTEYMLGYGWSIKSEYLYVQFSRSSYFSPTNVVTGAVFDTKLNDHIFRFGMNYKFGWGVGNVAPY
jgi:outer membrane immunogenic protein